MKYSGSLTWIKAILINQTGFFYPCSVPIIPVTQWGHWNSSRCMYIIFLKSKLISIFRRLSRVFIERISLCWQGDWYLYLVGYVSNTESWTTHKTLMDAIDIAHRQVTSWCGSCRTRFGHRQRWWRCILTDHHDTWWHRTCSYRQSPAQKACTNHRKPSTLCLCRVHALVVYQQLDGKITEFQWQWRLEKIVLRRLCPAIGCPKIWRLVLDLSLNLSSYGFLLHEKRRLNQWEGHVHNRLSKSISPMYHSYIQIQYQYTILIYNIKIHY